VRVDNQQQSAITIAETIADFEAGALIDRYILSDSEQSALTGIHVHEYTVNGQIDEAIMNAWLKNEGAAPGWWMPRLA